VIEEVITERRGERQVHQQAILEVPGLESVSTENDKEELRITLTGTPKEMKAFLRMLSSEIEKEL